MKRTTHDLGRPRAVLAALALLVTLAGLGVYFALTESQRGAGAPRAGEPGDESPVRIEGAPVPAAETGLAALPRSSDPQAFAVAVASALFAWDTASMTSHHEYAERLVGVGDPTGEESAALVADIANYLPTPSAWATLRAFGTRQSLEVTSARVPNLWSQALAEAGPDGLLPGTTAYTITGVRHRAGIWEGAPVASAHEVSFTVFMVCAPSYPTCHLLRLSLPDTPLD